MCKHVKLGNVGKYGNGATLMNISYSLYVLSFSFRFILSLYCILWPYINKAIAHNVHIPNTIYNNIPGWMRMSADNIVLQKYGNNNMTA